MGLIRKSGISAALVLAGLGAAAQEPAKVEDRDGLEFFEKKIRPVLIEKCHSCHSTQTRKLKANLYLDSREGMLKGGDSGPALVPGDPEKSRLIRAVRYKDEDLQMPPKDRLTDEQVANFEAWIKRGAPAPAGKPVAAAGPAIDIAKGRLHWAFQPPKDRPAPAVKNRTWVANPIDAFILARLEEKGLSPAPPADRHTLIRRVAHDLTGLPPTPEEVEAFVRDTSPDAYTKLVDRLLASPAYGERWGRHWLDVARYSDTKGYVFREERRYPASYTYRDWVVRALNEDLPYDQFLVQQVAADRLPLGEDKRPLAAMGFLTLGRRFLNRQPDIIDDRIDVLCRGTMALAVGCARCHDHKFDPIPTKDYYSLYGVFASSQEPKNLPVISGGKKTEADAAYEKELGEKQAAVDRFRAERHAALLPTYRKPETIAKCLLAAHEARNLNGDEELRALGQKREVPAFLIGRWKSFLAKTPETHPTMFSLWHAYAALPEKEFAAKAAGVKPPAHALAAAEFSQPPTSLAEVADRYGRLLARFDRDQKLADHGEETLRLVLRDGPPNVPLAEIDKAFNRADRDKLRDLEKKVEQLKVSHPGAPQHAMALEDGPIQNPRVFVRGNPNNPGDEVPRAFLQVLSPEKREPFKDGSGRLELARAIASKDNPLTARVFVNRVWAQHFGQALVRTPSDFGTRSDPPTHPELLDHLALKFIADGWSVKKLHKYILLSNAYRQSSDANPKYRDLDPENRLLSHMNRKRMDFEAMRDSLLAVSGQLDRTVGGRPVPLVTNPTAKTRMDAETIVNESSGDRSQDQYSTRRSIYLFIDRQNLPNVFRDFDFANPDTHCPQRFQTTVPQQALYLMNNPFALEQARKLAAREDFAPETDAARRIQKLYGLLYGRAATADEVALGRRFVEAESRGPALAAAPSQGWQHGYGEVDEATKRVKSFTPLPHFTGQTWQGGPKLPDAKLGWVILTAEGGHAGNDLAHAAIRRWTAPRDGEVSISGTLGHKEAGGNGVRARIVASGQGELASWTAHNTDAETKISRVAVKQGDTIDFVVDNRGDVTSDSFTWAPVLKMTVIVDATGATTVKEWSAQAGFAGPPGQPRATLAPWEKYAQVLMLSNEFIFVD